MTIPPPPPGNRLARGVTSAVSRLAKGGPERMAIHAGEIDAVIDYANSNVILLPAARRALREAVGRVSTTNREAVSSVWVANSLLAHLPASEYQRLLLDFEPLSVKCGQVLHEAGQPIGHVYFPVNCVVCLLATVEHPRSLGIGLEGREGMVGISLALGQKDSAVRTLVHTAGTALRMKAERFQEALPECPTLEQALYRHANAKLALARQAIACHRFHSIEQRLSRWLLMTRDRVGSGELALTQDFLAKMLGVRRGTINEVAGPLQQRGLISYSRGKIWILDPKGLEAISCRCYTKIED